jgi:hypothetical protein
MQDVLMSAVTPRDLPERQQTMTATVAWSYQLLSTHEQRAFRYLGALPSSFPIEAAASVLGGRDDTSSSSDGTLGVVAGLIDKSLVLRADAAAASRPVYLMLETVRAYAALQLAATGEREDALEGLTRYCTREAARAMEGTLGPAQIEWLDRVRDDLESYRVVLARLIEQSRSTEAADIAWRLVFFWVIRWHAAEGLRWYEQILSLPNLASGAESRALIGAALMWYTQADLSRARAALTRALRLAHDNGDNEGGVYAEIVLAHVEHAGGNEEAARTRFAHSVAGFRALAVPGGAVNALGGMAAVAFATGDDGEAPILLDGSDPCVKTRSVVRVRRAPRACDAGATRQPRRSDRDCSRRPRGDPNAAGQVRVCGRVDTAAAAAAIKGDQAWAARVLGASDAVSERTGAAIVDRSVQALKERTESARAPRGRTVGERVRRRTKHRSTRVDQGHRSQPLRLGRRSGRSMAWTGSTSRGPTGRSMGNRSEPPARRVTIPST